MAAANPPSCVPAPAPPRVLKFGPSSTTVSTVTVFTSLAEVTGTLASHAEGEGAYEVVLEGVPSCIVTDSVRVKGTGNFTIHEARRRRRRRRRARAAPSWCGAR